MDRKVLVPKMKKLGFSDMVCNLIDSYMQGRTNSVKVDGYVSDPVEVPTGVGEGSVLGPLIFLIQIIEVTEVMNVIREILEDRDPILSDSTELRTVQFADDCTNVVATDNEWQMEELLDVCSKEYHRYFSAQGMKLNRSKEEHIVHAHSKAARIKGDIKVDGREEAEAVKLLGITVNRDFKFTRHTNRVISNTNHRLAHVAKVKPLLGEKQFQMVLHSLVTSVHHWGMELAGRDQVNVRKLQKTQNSIMRVQTDSDMLMSVRYLLSKTNTLNVPNQTRLFNMQLMRKVILEGMCPRTMEYVRMPPPDSRHMQIGDVFPRETRHGPNSQLVKGLSLLNDMKWLKDKGKRESNKAFKKKAKAYLLAKFDNANVH